MVGKLLVSLRHFQFVALVLFLSPKKLRSWSKRHIEKLVPHLACLASCLQVVKFSAIFVATSVVSVKEKKDFAV